MAFPVKVEHYSDPDKHTELWRGFGWILYEHRNSKLDIMGTHIGCQEDHLDFEPEWAGQSFFLADMYQEDGNAVDGYCYGCGDAVPEQVQGLMVLFEKA